MIRLAFVVAVTLSLALQVAAQPLNPRIRIRVVGDNLLDNQALGTELSSTVYVDEVGSEKHGQLDRIDQFLKNKQWTEAADMLLRLSESDLNKLAPSIRENSADTAFPEFSRFVPLSRSSTTSLVHLRRQPPRLWHLIVIA